MRFTKQYFFPVLFGSLIAVAACKKKENVEPEPVTPSIFDGKSAYFSVEINNKDVVAFNDDVKTVKVNNKFNSDVVIDNHYFNLFIRDTFTVDRAYNLEDGGNGTFAIRYRDTSNLSAIYWSQSGKFMVTKMDEVNKLIFGEFSGTLEMNTVGGGAYYIKNGEFKLQYK